MKKIILVFLFLFNCFNAHAQQPTDVIAGILKSQREIKNISYTVIRRDTGVNGATRSFKGNVKVETNTADTTFGYKFWAKRDNMPNEFIYNGIKCYDLNETDKTYELLNKPNTRSWNMSSGRLLLPDLNKLDTLDEYTSEAVTLKATQDPNYYYLTINYADIKKYGVTKRSKWLKIDKKNMLPIAVRSHHEALGRVQDIYYEIANVVINNPANSYDFSTEKFLQGYQQQVNTRTISPAMSLKGNTAPDFELVDFDNTTVSLSKLQNKVVLLDFWEVWCGPCMEAMPKVDALYEQYKSKGLLVYGITNEVKQLDAARLLMKKRKTTFHILIGNEQLKIDYKLKAIPFYVLIDKNGKVVFVSVGYSTELEAAIKTALI